MGAAQDWIAKQRNFWAQRLQAMDDLLAEDADAPSTKTKKEKRKK